MSECFPIFASHFASFLFFTPQLFRHGDRSPVKAFPTDEHQESAWPQGFGQLSQVQKQDPTPAQLIMSYYFTGKHWQMCVLCPICVGGDEAALWPRPVSPEALRWFSQCSLWSAWGMTRKDGLFHCYLVPFPLVSFPLSSMTLQCTKTQGNDDFIPAVILNYIVKVTIGL